MNHTVLKSFTLTIFIFGVLSMNASEQSKSWEPLKISLDHIEASFPQKPIHMTFDLPLQGTDRIGQLNVYSTQVDEGLLMLSSIYSPLFDGKEINPKNFEKILYTFIIQRMFYQPHFFEDHKIINLEKSTVHKNPALRFSFSYQDHEDIKILSGMAVSKGSKLFILFYLASENKFEKSILEQFEKSFHFMD